MKVLILGAKGNLGSQLVKLLKLENDVTAWDNQEVDITDKGLVNKKVQDVKPEVIINTAAYNAVDKCEEDLKEYEVAQKINGDAVGFLADAAIAVGAKLVHYSTDYVFPGNSLSGYKEDDTPDPINKYAKTKLMGERELISRSGQGLKWYLIRTSKLFGPSGKSKLSKPNFFEKILALSVDKSSLDVVNGEISCFTYTIDLAKATQQLIGKRNGFGIYHIVNESPCSWFEAAREFFAQMEINIELNPVSTNEFPRPARRPKYSVLINTKLPRMRAYKEALSEYLANLHHHFNN